TGRRRSARAAATSGSRTESRRSSTRSASATASRLARRSAVVAPVTVMQSSGLDIPDFGAIPAHKKKASSAPAEEAWYCRRAVAGQARAFASSVALQYHHHAVEGVMAQRPRLNDARPIAEAATIANPTDPCQGDRPFLLDQ